MIFDTVPAIFLGLVEGHIRPLEESLGAALPVERSSDADGCGHPPLLAIMEAIAQAA